MNIKVKIDECEVVINDDQLTSRWKDQHERVKELIRECVEGAILLHKQQVSE